MNLLLIFQIIIQGSWVYNDQVSAGKGRPISVSKMKIIKFVNYDFDLNPSDFKFHYEDTSDQR